MQFTVNFVFIILSIIFQSLSGILGKYAAISVDLASPVSLLSNVCYLLSLGCLVFQAAVWQQALKHYDLSLAYPFQSLTMVVILIVSNVVFHEPVSGFNILGLCIILPGIYLLSQEMNGSTAR